jgi:hypothetical protein
LIAQLKWTHTLNHAYFKVLINHMIKSKVDDSKNSPRLIYHNWNSTWASWPFGMTKWIGWSIFISDGYMRILQELVNILTWQIWTDQPF